MSSDNTIKSYLNWRAENKLSIPNLKFPKTRKISVSLSEEAYKGLEELSRIFTTQGGQNIPNVFTLIESIGLYLLEVTSPSYQCDHELFISTDECQDAGYADAMEGEPLSEERIELLFESLAKQREFREAYLRGYYIGKHVKSKQ